MTIKYKSLKQFKEDHSLFFKNKPVGEKHNVHKGFLITTSYDWYNLEYVTKVWQVNDAGALLPVHYTDSVQSAKRHINTLLESL